MRLAFVTVILVSCLVACAAPKPAVPPLPPHAGSGGATASTPAPIETPVNTTASAPDCPVDQSFVPLQSDRVLRCRGIPFNVTFPDGAKVSQEKVGPGTSFLGLLKPAGIAALAVRPATFELMTTRDPKAGLDHSLDLLIDALKQNNPQVERRYDVKLGESISGRALDFTYPLGKKKVAGTMRAFLVGGWTAIVVAGGPDDTAMFRGKPDSNAFLDSLRIAPRDSNPVIVKLETGPTLTLPPDAWLSDNKFDKRAQGILRERVYALPELGTTLLLQEQDLAKRPCAQFVDAQQANPALGEGADWRNQFKILSVERKSLRGAPVLFVEVDASVEQGKARGLPTLPTSVALLCKEPTLLMSIAFGMRSRTELRATLESVLATFDTKGQTQPSMQQVAK